MISFHQLNLTRLACGAVACATLGSALAQSVATPDTPTLTGNFSFTLLQHHDAAIRQTMEAMQARDVMQRTLDLKAADASVFTRAIDLFRFVPFQLRSSDVRADDFFTPNYMRPDYKSPAAEARLFDTH
jgi:hypothetical protein